MSHLSHVVESQQFSLDFLEKLFSLADQMRADKSQYNVNGKVLASLFYEPSTRTRLSFESAMLQLGGTVISTENAKEFSSHSKGESLEDSIRVISGYADIIAIRHFEIGTAKRAASASKVPVINAGDGAGQHPTQALLDLYTIKRSFDQLDGLTICMVGDLRYGRTVRSLSYLLARFFKVKFIFVAPPICKMNQDILDYFNEMNIESEDEDDFTTAVSKADCIYMTRIQKERFLDMQRYDKAYNQYRVDNSTIPHLKENAIVLHPLPRLEEINPEVDKDPRMKYFEQAQNGVWVRMALIYLLLNPEFQA